MNKKRITGAALATALLFAPLAIQTSTAMADSFYTQQTNAERADITNWVANTTEDISNNINAQHIDTSNLHGNEYIIQWGDTLSGISDATGIPMAKLAYDNNIQNIDLIYAGDTLVLNRDGEVPSDWHYYGDGVYVAKTKVTINNFVDNSHNTVNINVSPISHEEGSSSSKSKDDSSEYISDLDPDGKKGEAASDTDSSSDSKSSSKNHHSDSKSDSDEMDESDFSDAVSNEVSSKLGLNDGKLTVDFTGKDDDSDSDVNTDDTSDDSDSDTEDVYDNNQNISTGSDKLTDENAEKLADKIVAQLKADGKTKDIDKADNVELMIEANDDDFSFNVTLTTTDDSDSDEDSNSDDSDADTDSEGADSEDVDSSSDESSDEDTDFDDESEDADTDTEDEDQNSSSEDEDSNNQVTTNDDENTDTEE
ncbi:LysM peptidoglycan-binding domain-containing protein [Pediococcus pentosaceus]|uniref:LysM peptidoglycan-binding domain-containing protein n=1 Tax=Pediococcus pentosaceus TaxID=1255 RepID=UPI001303E1BE|nr:LysM domain-containing protein [Pediococcus pentosaceus]QGZ69342.1 LysM peptidoglycan-binding domain-containing protein [Pediococcus pentosaceus]